MSSTCLITAIVVGRTCKAARLGSSPVQNSGLFARGHGRASSPGGSPSRSRCSASTCAHDGWPRSTTVGRSSSGGSSRYSPSTRSCARSRAAVSRAIWRDSLRRAGRRRPCRRCVRRFSERSPRQERRRSAGIADLLVDLREAVFPLSPHQFAVVVQRRTLPAAGRIRSRQVCVQDSSPSLRWPLSATVVSGRAGESCAGTGRTRWPCHWLSGISGRCRLYGACSWALSPASTGRVPLRAPTSVATLGRGTPKVADSWRCDTGSPRQSRAWR